MMQNLKISAVDVARKKKMRAGFLAIVVIVTLLLALLVSRYGSPSSSADRVSTDEINRLRFANSLLQSKVNGFEARLQAESDKALGADKDMKRRRRRHARELGDPPCVCPPCAVNEAAPPPPPAISELLAYKRAMADLQVDNARMKRRVTELEAQFALQPSKPSAAKQIEGCAHVGGDESSKILAKELLDLHSHWDWRTIVNDMFQPWPRIERGALDTAVRACNDNGTMYCQRMQIIDGQLYLTDYRAIFFDRHYAPARVMPILETLRRHPDLPNIDIVVAGNDEPRFPSIPGERFSWGRTCSRWSGRGKDLPPAIFASTVNRAVFDLPWLDFAWFFPRRPHKLRTKPWSELQPALVAAGKSVKWGDKIELAMHTGNVMSPSRKVLIEEAKRSPKEILVNELFIGDHGKIRSTCAQLGLHKTGGFQQHKCYMTFAEQCGYKYLLNSASIGYANKLKSLLLCGSVVIYVRDGMRHHEFYEFGLLPGVHYIAVDAPKDVPPMVRWLQQHDDYARAVALAGQARMATLDVGALTDFMATVLRTYAKRQAFRPQVQDGAVRVNCEDDLWRHYSLSKGWMNAYLMEDNATCITPIPQDKPLGPPGWGGAYAGSKPRCYASHDLAPRAQPQACDFQRPFSTSESFEPYGAFPKPHPRDPEHWLTE